MACGSCGLKRGHAKNCPAAGGGGGGGGVGGDTKVPRHKHSFTIHIRRGGGLLGPVYDVWGCDFPGCSATETRNV